MLTIMTGSGNVSLRPLSTRRQGHSHLLTCTVTHRRITMLFFGRMGYQNQILAQDVNPAFTRLAVCYEPCLKVA